MEIGQLCVKLAGRDAGRVCAVIEVTDKNFVLIDGNVRRRKCNVDHLEPLAEVIKIKKGASHADVVAEFKKLKLDSWNTKAKKPAAQVRKQRKTSGKVKPAAAEKPKAEKKAPAKKAAPKSK